MKTRLLLTTLVWLFAIAASAQTYIVKSLEGTPQKINIVEDHNLTIKYGGGKILINNFWALGDVRVLNNNFLKVEYRVRGGSCIGISRVMLLCVSNNKLVAAMNVFNMLSSCGADLDAMYTLEFKITGTNARQYKIPVRIHDKKDVTDPRLGKSYNKYWTATLSFDAVKGIFFNGSKTLNSDFKVFRFNGNEIVVTTKEHIKGVFPVITVKNTDSKDVEYYYIKNHWYGHGFKNELNECY